MLIWTMDQKHVPRLDRLFPDLLFHVQKLCFTDQISKCGIYTRAPLPVFISFS